MHKKTAHITIEGSPLCECQNNRLGYPLGSIHFLTCDYISIASATRAKVELQKLYHSVKVVRGNCPYYQET